MDKKIRLRDLADLLQAAYHHFVAVFEPSASAYEGDRDYAGLMGKIKHYADGMDYYEQIVGIIGDLSDEIFERLHLRNFPDIREIENEPDLKEAAKEAFALIKEIAAEFRIDANEGKALGRVEYDDRTGVGKYDIDDDAPVVKRIKGILEDNPRTDLSRLRHIDIARGLGHAKVWYADAKRRRDRAQVAELAALIKRLEAELKRRRGQ